MPSWGGWDEIRNLLQVGKVQTHVSHLDERCWQCFAKALLKLQVMRLLNNSCGKIPLWNWKRLFQVLGAWCDCK